jgi:hypothetical protein
MMRGRGGPRGAPRGRFPPGPGECIPYLKLLFILQISSVDSAILLTGLKIFIEKIYIQRSFPELEMINKCLQLHKFSYHMELPRKKH